MGLSKEEKETLERLNKKAKEPDGPPAGVNFNLDLSSDTAWERAKKIGIIRDDDEGTQDDDDDDDDGREDDDTPKRRSYFSE